MKKLTCEMCGSTDLLKQDGVFVCQSCGSKYSVEEARRMMIDGTVEVKGKVSIDNTAKLDNLYKVTRRAREDGNINLAFKYYEQLNMEDPDNWEPAFFVAYYSAINILKNDKEGDSVRVIGNTVKLGGNYRSGIRPSINAIANCLDGVFNFIENIKVYEEQKTALETVGGYVESISGELYNIIDSEFDRMSREIYDFGQQTETGILNKYNMDDRNESTRNDYITSVSDMLDLVKNRKKKIEEIAGKRRLDEYWAAHQSEKEALESERKSLFEQLNVLDSEISTTPQKVEGYSTMLELQKKVENLASEKKSLSLFKLKEKKAIQEQIDSTNNEIVPIQSRINSAIEEVQKRISSLQSRIKAIDTELTKSR